MTDKELLRKIMYLKEWTQLDLAAAMDFNQSNISRVIAQKQELSMEKRQQAEEILRTAEDTKPRQSGI